MIAFLVTIFLGLGAGWLAGSVLSGTLKPSPVEENKSVMQPVETASLNTASLNTASLNTAAEPKTETNANEADEVKQSAPVVEEQGDKDEPKTRARRRAGSRRAYVAAHKGEPIPLAVIKGKPLKKAFRQFRRVRIW